MNALLLDYDTMRAASALLSRLPFIASKLRLKVVVMWSAVSSSKKGVHVVVIFNRMLTPYLIVALQTMCGSDYRRESFNLVRAMNLPYAPTFWRSRWNVLYAEKWRAGQC